MGNAPVAPLGPNQVDIVSEQICCEDPAWWTFKQAASHPVPHLLAPYMSQAEYSGALAGVNQAIDESNKCGGVTWTPGVFWLFNAVTMCYCLIPCCCYWLGFRKPQTIRRIDDALAPFREKGLQAHYVLGDGGGEHHAAYPSRIRVTVPATLAPQQVMGAPAFSSPNEVSLMINDPGCCGAHYSLQSRVPDPRLLAFVTADEHAKKLEALDEMFVAQRSRVRLLEKLKRHRRVVALVLLTLLTSTVTGIVTSVMFAQGRDDWKCAEKEGECSNAIDAYENSCCNFWCCSSQYRDNITDAAELLGADAYEHSSWKPYAYVGFQSVSKGGLSTQLDSMCYDRTLRKRSRRQKERKRPDPGCKSDSFVCGLEEQGDDEAWVSPYEGEHSCVLYVEGKIVRQEGVYWPHYLFIPVALIFYFTALAYMVDSCRYKSRVIKGAAAIFADWHYNGGSPPRFDPGAAADGYGSPGRPCRLIFTLPQMQAPVMVTVQVQIPAGALPGSTFSVAAPGGGAPVQVQVPPGGVPGSTIFAQVPQAPVQGAVVQAAQAVPGGVELCAKQ